MLRRKNAKQASLAMMVAGATLSAGCSDNNPATAPKSSPKDGGVITVTPDGEAPYDAGPTIDLDAGTCLTTFTFPPPAGQVIQTVAVAGEWDNFAAAGTPMIADGNGTFTAKLPLATGNYAYKLIVNGQWELDPNAATRKYVGGVENSEVIVTDCYAPTLSLNTQTNAQGHYVAQISFQRGAAGTQIDPATIVASLKNDFTSTPTTVSLDLKAETISADLPNLKNGKYTLFVDAKDREGRAAKTLRLVFWSEVEAYDWRDALIYMAVTDRLKNGDTSNDVPPADNTSPKANFENGDFAGVTQVIASGALDKLGVRALWLTPFQTNPKTSYPDGDGVHMVTGYHGYWPIKGREVEPRLGGDAALENLVKMAHAHGIRVLMDFVINQVHQEHEYFKAHPEWFRTGCICGTNNCDWTVHRLDCLFASYMPDVNWTVPAVSDQWSDDAVYWIDRFDLDGLRMDAVKQVEDIAVINMSARIRKEFEASGTHFFLTGETAMGWSDCGLACNQYQYDTINEYIGPAVGATKLDGQFDFPLYYAAPMQAFTRDTHGMIHVDYWTQASGLEYPLGSIMSPYIGSQDTPRFVTIADYRGQDAAHDPSIPGNKWSNVAAAPTSSEPYSRLRTAMAWLLGIPGAPMVYSGDEYGEWGGADPNNRTMWRGDQTLSSDEAATLSFVQTAGQARRDLVALRRGDYRHVFATETVLVFARQTEDGKTVIVAISRDTTQQTVTATLPVTVSLPEGATLHDKFGGPDVQVTSGAITITLAPHAAAILAP